MVLALEFVLSLVAVERCSKSVAGFFISGWKKLKARYIPVSVKRSSTLFKQWLCISV